MRAHPVSPDAALSAYIARARAIPRLSREEECALSVRASAGDTAAAQRLAAGNLRFVVAVALQYRRYGIPVADLIAEGSVGLLVAVSKFDPGRGTRFVTYAGYWIRAYVLELIVRSSSLVGGGMGALRSKVFFRLRRERAQLANTEPDSGRVIATLAERFHVDPDRMSQMLHKLDTRDLSLDASARADGSASMLDTLHDGADTQEDALLAHETHQRIAGCLGSALGSLDERERYIVEQRVMGEPELSLAELGRQLGVSRERARQLEVRAKRKLRAQLADLNDAA